MFIALGLYYFFISILELFDVSISKKFFAFFALIPAFFLTAFRDISVGCDTRMYFHGFNVVSSFDSLQDAFASLRYEKGYVFIEYLFSKFHMSFFSMQLGISIFFYISLFFLLTKYSKNIGISCFLFLTLQYIFGPMNVVRSYIAIAILWYSIPFIQRRNYFVFALIVLFASMFHKTAFVFLFLYPLVLVDFSLKRIGLFISVAGLLGFLGKTFFIYLVSLTGAYESYLDGKYLNFSGNVAVYLVFAIDICLVAFILYNKKEKFIPVQSTGMNISIEKICFAASLVMICCDIIGFNFALMGRITDFFSFCWLILLPLTFMQIKNKISAFISLMFFAICLFAQFYVIMILRPNWHCVEPYQFYLGEIF